MTNLTDRRRFLSLFGAAIAAPALPKRIYCFAPPNGWTLSDSGIYSYRYAYRSVNTGCVSDPIVIAEQEISCIDLARSVFSVVQSYDAVDLYRRAPGEDEYRLMWSGVWSTLSPEAVSERLPS